MPQDAQFFEHPQPCAHESIPCGRESVPCERESIPCGHESIPCERESIPCGHESMHYSKCANTHTSRADNNASGTFVISIS
jgi:hypothetical protein